MRAIARETGFHRLTVKRIVSEGGPPEYSRPCKPQRPVLDPYTAIIDEMLKQDILAPRKQRHTAQRVFNRLKEEHDYPGGYTQVRLYVAQARTRQKEAYIPLEFGPGEAQVDWGEAVALDETREPPDSGSTPFRKVFLFVMTLPFSDARFVAAFPRQTQEFFFEGHRNRTARRFSFLAACPGASFMTILPARSPKSCVAGGVI